MPTDWKKLYAMKKKAIETLQKNTNVELTNDSGIYVLTRDDETGLKFAYVGQAKHVLDRLVSHMIGYSQRIDLSLRKRGFWSPCNKPFGWTLNVIYCSEKELDQLEKNLIQEIASQGYQLYNKTSGGQGIGKVGIDENKAPKGYRDGLKQGYKNAIKDVKEYFDKYLLFMTRRTKDCYKKDGKTLKEIYVKKFEEFARLLYESEEKTEKTE